DAERAAAAAANQALGQTIAQPAAGTGEHFDMFGQQADLFAQFAVERVFGCFLGVDAALGELPCILADTTCPQHFALRVRDHDAYIGAETVGVDHGNLSGAYVKEVDSIVPQKPRAEQSAPAPVSIVLSRCDTGKLGAFWRMRWAAVALAIFDLDNTLLGGDSDHAWGEFLARKGIVDAVQYRDANDRFFQDYQSGSLDIHAYLAFALEPLTRYSVEQLT